MSLHLFSQRFWPTLFLREEISTTRLSLMEQSPKKDQSTSCRNPKTSYFGNTFQRMYQGDLSVLALLLRALLFFLLPRQTALFDYASIVKSSTSSPKRTPTPFHQWDTFSPPSTDRKSSRKSIFVVPITLFESPRVANI